MYRLNNLSLSAREKEHNIILVKLLNDSFFHCVKSKHKISLQNIDSFFEELVNTEIISLFNNDSLIGFLELSAIDTFNKSSMLNIVIDPISFDFLKNGGALIKMISEYLLRMRGFNKISTDILMDDSAVIALFKQRQFIPEIHKRAHRFVSGQYKTVVELSLLGSDLS